MAQNTIKEQLEVFLPDGTRTGKGVDRKRAHAEGILHGASHIFICRKENGAIEMLLQRRSPNKDSYPGCLDISSAGHVERGSDFEETALKEMSEELGLNVPPQELKMLFIQHVNLTSNFHGEQFIDREVNAVYLYIPKEELHFTLQPEELSEVIWMDIEAVLERVREGDSEYCLEADEFEKAVEKIREIMK